MKKIAVLWALIFFNIVPLFSQKLQIAPVFPGGVNQLKTELIKNLRKEFKDFKDHPSTIRINFSVTKRGRPVNGTAPQFDDSIVQKKIAKAVRKLPRFKPGSANGKVIISDVSIEVKL